MNPNRALLFGIALALAAALAALGMGIAVRWQTQQSTVFITEARLRAELEKRFPIERPVFLLLNYRFDHPRLELLPEQDRIAFGVDLGLDARLDGARTALKGRIDVKTGLRYDDAQGALYLVDPVITELALDGVPEKHLSRVQDGARLLLADVFAQQPVYRLKDSDLRQRALKHSLRDLRVTPYGVALVFGSSDTATR